MYVKDLSVWNALRCFRAHRRNVQWLPSELDQRSPLNSDSSNRNTGGTARACAPPLVLAANRQFPHKGVRGVIE